MQLDYLMTDDRPSILLADIVDVPTLADTPMVEAAQEAEQAMLVTIDAELSEMFKYEGCLG